MRLEIGISGLDVVVSTDPSVRGLPCGAFSAPPSFINTTTSVAPVASDGPNGVMDGEGIGGGMEGEAEPLLVLEFPQKKLHHWACTGEEKRRKRARGRQRALIL